MFSTFTTIFFDSLDAWRGMHTMCDRTPNCHKSCRETASPFPTCSSRASILTRFGLYLYVKKLTFLSLSLSPC